ncbi:hypothetical protein SODALDRAFT_358067 [Sodiomyces alkalinus F11]|uniref:Uncharacterized protein n=1 Tax=Sodiomyces alkalinus (strain CBS 110278 / VKM F-3762 / F11) TaxID=1314773 RepID=A0A3N2PYT3_SODAK|nr:hypothetical protein SODALDRAFT_358067 [Sodiomyces alkalinus F11]ROT39654.1 hypothetical protein SODALDRAFT_358067 [Sodiomyces alkalinus F11]
MANGKWQRHKRDKADDKGRGQKARAEADNNGERKLDTKYVVPCQCQCQCQCQYLTGEPLPVDALGTGHWTKRSTINDQRSADPDPDPARPSQDTLSKAETTKVLWTVAFSGGSRYLSPNRLTTVESWAKACGGIYPLQTLSVAALPGQTKPKVGKRIDSERSRVTCPVLSCQERERPADSTSTALVAPCVILIPSPNVAVLVDSQSANCLLVEEPSSHRERRRISGPRATGL